MSWPISEPSPPPVAMIGPSAPNGPPVPMAIAADSGLRNMIFGEMRLRLYSTRSITSGMPCPRMAAAPYRAMMPTTTAPAIGTKIDQTPSRSVLGAVNSADRRPKYERFVMIPISRVKIQAINAPPAPTPIARSEMTITRRSTGERHLAPRDGRWRRRRVDRLDFDAANRDHHESLILRPPVGRVHRAEHRPARRLVDLGSD